MGDEGGCWARGRVGEGADDRQMLRQLQVFNIFHRYLGPCHTLLAIVTVTRNEGLPSLVIWVVGYSILDCTACVLFQD